MLSACWAHFLAAHGPGPSGRVREHAGRGSLASGALRQPGLSNDIQAATYCRISTCAPVLARSFASLSSSVVTDSLMYASPQLGQTRAGTHFTTIVRQPRSRVTVVVPVFVDAFLQITHFMKFSSCNSSPIQRDRAHRL